MLVSVEIRLVDARTGRELAKAGKNQVFVTGNTYDVNGGTYRVERVGDFDDANGAVTVWLAEVKK